MLRALLAAALLALAVPAFAAALSLPDVPVVAAPGAPRGVHLSFTDDPTTTATVAWFTSSLGNPQPYVEYGATVDLGQTVRATSQKATGVNHLVHEATMRALAPGQTVHYRVCGTSGCSPVRTFETLPPADAPLRVAIFGDHGVKDTSALTVQRVLAEDPDVVLLAGDLAYANGNHPVWDTWFDVLEPLASRVPVLAAIGNHENEDAAGTGTQSFRTRLAQPGAELYFGIDLGRMHVLALQSDETSALNEGILHEMLDYAEADLADARARRDAGELDFVVVLQHHPLYATTQDSEVPYVDRQINFQLVALEEHLLVRHEVDVLVAAHNHNYERTTPMAFRTALSSERTTYEDPAGYIELITGGGGQSLYSFDPEQEPWSAVRARQYHYTIFDLEPGVLRAKAVSTQTDPGVVLDAWTLSR